jgi:hypothetical protein
LRFNQVIDLPDSELLELAISTRTEICPASHSISVAIQRNNRSRPTASCTKTKSRDTVAGMKTALVTGTSDRMTAAEWVDLLSKPNDDRFQARAAEAFRGRPLQSDVALQKIGRSRSRRISGDGMKTKNAEQAELILRLYELRRETVMREARSFVSGSFLPRSDDDLVAIVTQGGKETGFVLQVYGYWDMVCAFVLHGMLSEPLVYDTCQEMYFNSQKFILI